MAIQTTTLPPGGHPYSPTSLSLDEFDAFVKRDDNADRDFELIRGEVVEMPRPRRLHGKIQAELIRFLGNYAAKLTPPGEVSTESGLILRLEPPTVRGPDVAFYVVAPDPDLNAWDDWYSTPPHIVVEIISPNDRQKDLFAKVDDYLTAGVGYVWTVNPEEQFIAVYRKDASPKGYGMGQAITCPELPGFELPIALLFGSPTFPNLPSV